MICILFSAHIRYAKTHSILGHSASNIRTFRVDDERIVNLLPVIARDVEANTASIYRRSRTFRPLSMQAISVIMPPLKREMLLARRCWTSNRLHPVEPLAWLALMVIDGGLPPSVGVPFRLRKIHFVPYKAGDPATCDAGLPRGLA